MKSQKKPSFFGAVVYDNAGSFKGGGPVRDAYAIRKGDEFVSRDELRIVARSPSEDRYLEIEIGKPLLLAKFLADLALAEPEGDESADDCNRRLAFRDDLVKAFEEAASSLRKAPR